MQHSRADSLEREVVLVKLSTEPLKGRDAMSDTELLSVAHDRRQALLGIAQLFDATVADIGSRHAILQLTSWPKRWVGRRVLGCASALAYSLSLTHLAAPPVAPRIPVNPGWRRLSSC